MALEEPKLTPQQATSPSVMFGSCAVSVAAPHVASAGGLPSRLLGGRRCRARWAWVREAVRDSQRLLSSGNPDQE